LIFTVGPKTKLFIIFKLAITHAWRTGGGDCANLIMRLMNQTQFATVHVVDAGGWDPTPANMCIHSIRINLVLQPCIYLYLHCCYFLQHFLGFIKWVCILQWGISFGVIFSSGICFCFVWAFLNWTKFSSYPDY